MQLEDLKLKLGRAVAASNSEVDAIPRQRYRTGIRGTYHSGWDIWNAFEVSCLDETGKPLMFHMRLWIPADSPNIIESKSLKLYLNSLNNKTVQNHDTFKRALNQALIPAIGKEIKLELQPVERSEPPVPNTYWGQSLDDCSLTRAVKPHAKLLVPGPYSGPQTWTSHLFRSLCPVTAQPDWASIRIELDAEAVSPAGILSYLVAYREHAAFHEACCEQIMSDVCQAYHPKYLQITCYFARRGGLDIHPTRWMGEPPSTYQTFFR